MSGGWDLDKRAEDAAATSIGEKKEREAVEKLALDPGINEKMAVEG